MKSQKTQKHRKHKSTENTKAQRVNQISGRQAFDLFQSYGFPLELTRELAGEKGIEIDEKGFDQEMKKHQELSRTAAAGKFKGGLADHSEQVVKYHTAAHLLLAGLRRILGPHVVQKGSNITAERLRLDFSHPEKMTSDQIKEVEDLVNGWIKDELSVGCEKVAFDQAMASGAMGVFTNKYGEKVKVYSIGNGEETVSKEICGGPHVKNTSELGRFKIKKEAASSAGVRRIKAVLE